MMGALVLPKKFYHKNTRKPSEVEKKWVSVNPQKSQYFLAQIYTLKILLPPLSSALDWCPSHMVINELTWTFSHPFQTIQNRITALFYLLQLNNPPHLQVSLQTTLIKRQIHIANPNALLVLTIWELVLQIQRMTSNVHMATAFQKTNSQKINNIDIVDLTSAQITLMISYHLHSKFPQRTKVLFFANKNKFVAIIVNSDGQFE